LVSHTTTAVAAVTAFSPTPVISGFFSSCPSFVVKV